MKRFKKVAGIMLALALALSVIPVIGIGGSVKAEAAIAKAKIYLVKGQKGTVDEYGNYSEGSEENPIAGAKWSSSKKSVVKISKKGVITAKKKGTATVTAKVGGKAYFKATVKVEVPKISKKTIDVIPGQQPFTLNVKGISKNQQVTWSTLPKTEADSDESLKQTFVNEYDEGVISLSPDYEDSRKCTVNIDPERVGDVVILATVGTSGKPESVVRTIVHSALKKVDPSTIQKQEYRYKTQDGVNGVLIVLTNTNAFTVKSTVKVQFSDAHGYINRAESESGITKLIEPGQRALFDCVCSDGRTSDINFTNYVPTINTTGSTVKDDTNYVKDLKFWTDPGSNVSMDYASSIVTTVLTDTNKTCGSADIGVILFRPDGTLYGFAANNTVSFSNGIDRDYCMVPLLEERDKDDKVVTDKDGNPIYVQPDLTKTIVCINKGYGRS